MTKSFQLQLLQRNMSMDNYFNHFNIFKQQQQHHRSNDLYIITFLRYKKNCHII